MRVKMQEKEPFILIHHFDFFNIRKMPMATRAALLIIILLAIIMGTSSGANEKLLHTTSIELFKVSVGAFLGTLTQLIPRGNNNKNRSSE